MALTANSYQGLRPLMSRGTNAVPVYDGPVAASQTIVAGDPLIFSSGLLAKGAGTSTLVVGIAAEAITTGASVTIAGNRVRYYPLNTRLRWVGNIANGATDLTSSQSNIGVAYGIVEQGSGAGTWTVDSSNTTQKLFRTIDWAPAAYQTTGADVVVGTTINAAVILEACDAETVNVNS